MQVHALTHEGLSELCDMSSTSLKRLLTRYDINGDVILGKNVGFSSQFSQEITKWVNEQRIAKPTTGRGGARPGAGRPRVIRSRAELEYLHMKRAAERKRKARNQVFLRLTGHKKSNRGGARPGAGRPSLINRTVKNFFQINAALAALKNAAN
jgi:hypothetical protein